MSQPIRSQPEGAPRVLSIDGPLDGLELAHALKDCGSANGDPFWREIFSRLLAIGLVEALAQETSLTSTLGLDAIDFAQRRGTRLLTADFKAGDVLVFGMYLAHGSLDHHDESGMVRVSCDVRWQPTRLPIDERYFGKTPAGTTGAGYGELNGAKPLNVDWHVR